MDREPDQRWRRGWSRGQELIGDIELGIFCVSEAQHGLPSTCDRYGPGLPFSPLSKEGDEFAVSTPLGTSSSRSFAEKLGRSFVHGRHRFVLWRSQAVLPPRAVSADSTALELYCYFHLWRQKVLVWSPISIG